MVVPPRFRYIPLLASSPRAIPSYIPNAFTPPADVFRVCLCQYCLPPSCGLPPCETLRRFRVVFCGPSTNERFCTSLFMVCDPGSLAASRVLLADVRPLPCPDRVTIPGHQAGFRDDFSAYFPTLRLFSFSVEFFCTKGRCSLYIVGVSCSGVRYAPPTPLWVNSASFRSLIFVYGTFLGVVLFPFPLPP